MERRTRWWLVAGACAFVAVAIVAAGFVASARTPALGLGIVPYVIGAVIAGGLALLAAVAALLTGRGARRRAQVWGAVAGSWVGTALGASLSPPWGPWTLEVLLVSMATAPMFVLTAFEDLPESWLVYVGAIAGGILGVAIGSRRSARSRDGT